MEFRAGNGSDEKRADANEECEYFCGDCDKSFATTEALKSHNCDEADEASENDSMINLIKMEPEMHLETE